MQALCRPSFAAQLLVVALGVACAVAPRIAAPTATPVTPITREKSIEIARQACQISDVVMIGETRNIRAQLIPSSEGREPPKWMVNMDGTAQLIGGVEPTPGGPSVAPPTPYAATCAVTINAKTGDMISLGINPLVTTP